MKVGDAQFHAFVGGDRSITASAEVLEAADRTDSSCNLETRVRVSIVISYQQSPTNYSARALRQFLPVPLLPSAQLIFNL